MTTLTWTCVFYLYTYIIWRMPMFPLSKLLYKYATSGLSRLPRGVPCLPLSSCLMCGIGFSTYLPTLDVTRIRWGLSFTYGRPSLLNVSCSGIQFSTAAISKCQTLSSLNNKVISASFCRNLTPRSWGQQGRFLLPLIMSSHILGYVFLQISSSQKVSGGQGQPKVSAGKNATRKPDTL